VEVLIMGVMNCQWRSGVVCATLLLAVTACNSGDESAATTSVVTAAPTTTVATTSTTVVAAAAPVTTEVPSTIAPSTIPAATSSPTTAPGDEEAAKAAVIAAAIEAKEAFWAARQDPTNQVLTERLGDALGGANETFALGVIAEMMAAGEYTMPNPTVGHSYEVRLDSVQIDFASGTATIESCEVDSWILMRIDSGGGEPTVVDDGVLSNSLSEQFSLVAGSWIRVNGAQLATAEGPNSCAV
jgi:hypothetical protein